MKRIVFKFLRLKALPIISGVHIGYKNESLGISVCSLIFPLTKKVKREKYNQSKYRSLIFFNSLNNIFIHELIILRY